MIPLSVKKLSTDLALSTIDLWITEQMIESGRVWLRSARSIERGQGRIYDRRRIEAIRPVERLQIARLTKCVDAQGHDDRAEDAT
jgi:hypothetical protein